MNVENLVPLTHPFNNRQNLTLRVLKPLSNGTNAEIKPVVFAVIELSKPFDAFEYIRAVPPGDAAVTGMGGRIGDVVAELHLIFFGYRKYPIEEVGSAFKHIVDGNCAVDHQCIVVFDGFSVVPGAVRCIAAIWVDRSCVTTYGQYGGFVVQ